MGRLRARLRRAEQRATPLYDVVCLKDGTRVTLAPGECLEAFCAMLEERSHPLLDLIPHIDLEASPQSREMVELVEAFQAPTTPKKEESARGWR